MASYNELNALIDAYINQNGVQAITGQILNGVLKAMVEQLGRGYTIMGAATPTTDPGTPDGPECYFASETGTYTDFDGLQVVPGELALLCYTPTDGWTKETIYEGFQSVGATIDGNVGTPSVGVSYANGVLSFDFHNMKGNTGDPAGFGTIGATVDGNIGTPGVTVQESGPATAKNLTFAFTNLKGETGVTSVVATVDNTVGTPSCAVSLNGQVLTLAFSGLKGAQGDTGVSADYPIAIVNNLTTNDPASALSAAMGVQLESEISQLSQEVDGAESTVTETVTLATISTLSSNGLIKDDGVTIQASGAGKYTDYISLEDISGNLTVTGWAVSNKLVFFYDSNKAFLSYALSGQQSAVAVQIPAGAAYIRVNGVTQSYLEGQSATAFATNVTGQKTTTVRTGGLVADVATLKSDVQTLQGTVGSNTSRIEALEARGTGAVDKYLHISFDDAYRILKYLDTDSPTSIFEEPRMAMCKQLHDTYGAVFSFYLFADEINADTEEVLWSIESTPSTYKAQFEACRDWIKFGYHTKNRNSNAGNFTTAQLLADYARIVTVVQNCIGLGSLDRMPRLGGYVASEEQALALRDTDAGILGLLGPDDPRQGYYMTSSEANWLNSHDRWHDYTNQLAIVKTDLRMEASGVYDNIASVIAGWETAAYANKVRELILFTHEGVAMVSTYNIADNLDTICAWAVAQGYDFDYPQNRTW